MDDDARRAIIDIGSNSVRLVVYSGPARAPATLFNEKVSAGLGEGVGEGGPLPPKGVKQALKALTRFQMVTRAMGIESIRTVATAAVRDASDGAAFLARTRDMGLDVELLTGVEEATASGMGVASAFPGANGIVGDLGGGSLELVRIRDGAISRPVSLPLGVLRLPAIRAKSRGALDRQVKKLMTKSGWSVDEAGLPFYLVGGSWRALARLHMYLTDYPLPVLHNYTMPPEAAVRLVRALGRMDRKRLKAIDVLPSGRIPALGDAAALLATLTRHMGCGALVVSAFGLREGLLYADLAAPARLEDPLIAATREAGALLGRFPEHGDVLARWIAPLFTDEDARFARLRHAACLLSDVAWNASPELRAERALDIALYGNWVGVDARERAMLAQALFAGFGGQALPATIVGLTSVEDRAAATRWGLAIRLGQRLSGGAAGPLAISTLSLVPSKLVLTLKPEYHGLVGEAVERRHRQLAANMDRRAVVA